MLQPESPQPSTTGELLDLAFQAEAYINGSARKQRQKIRRAVTQLNVAASDLYLGTAVNLTGLMVSASPTPRRESPELVETHLEYRSVDGAAAGFTVLDLEDDLAPISANLDSQELELLDVLRERTYGRFAICHLVSYLGGNWEPKTMLTSTDVTYRAAGPIATSRLFTTNGTDKIPLSERHREVGRIIDTLPDSQQKLLNHICTQVVESDDPMTDLAASGRKLRALFTQANEIDRLALMHVLDFHVDMVLTGRSFLFERGLPASIEPVGGDSANFWTFDGKTPVSLRIDGVANAQFYKDAEVPEATLTDERSLYLRTTAWDEEGRTSTLLVPVEHLHAYPYAELPAENSEIQT